MNNIVHAGYAKAGSTYLQKVIFPHIPNCYLVLPPEYDVTENNEYESCPLKMFLHHLLMYRLGNSASLFFQSPEFQTREIEKVREYVSKLNRRVVVSYELIAEAVLTEQRFIDIFDFILDKPEWVIFIREQHALINSGILGDVVGNGSSRVVFTEGLPTIFTVGYDMDIFHNPTEVRRKNYRRMKAVSTTFLGLYNYNNLIEILPNSRTLVVPFESFQENPGFVMEHLGIDKETQFGRL